MKENFGLFVLKTSGLDIRIDWGEKERGEEKMLKKVLVIALVVAALVLPVVSAPVDVGATAYCGTHCN